MKLMKQRLKKKKEKVSETKSWFFERINKIAEYLGRLTQKKRECAQINKIRNERGSIVINTKEYKES